MRSAVKAAVSSDGKTEDKDQEIFEAKQTLMARRMKKEEKIVERKF